MIQAIETKYKNNLFRSKLEAKYAMLFDIFGIAWDYEPECYKLKDGSLYTPDFYIPEMDLFFEIKGVYPNNEEKKKAYMLSSGAKKVVLIANGFLSRDNFENKNAHNITAFSGENSDIFLNKNVKDTRFQYKLDLFSSNGIKNIVDRNFIEEKIDYDFSTEINGLFVESSENTRKKLIELDYIRFKKFYPNGLKGYKDHQLFSDIGVVSNDLMFTINNGSVVFCCDDMMSDYPQFMDDEQLLMLNESIKEVNNYFKYKFK